MKRFSLAVLVCLAPLSASADVVLIGAPSYSSPITLVEGKQSNPIQFTIENQASASASAVTIDQNLLWDMHYSSGDYTDSPLGGSGLYFSCGGQTLAVGGTCAFSLTIDSFLDGNETDGDQGVYNLQIGVSYKTPNGGSGQAQTGEMQVIVKDPPAPVPEPTSMCLFGTVLAVSGLLIRRKHRAALR